MKVKQKKLQCHNTKYLYDNFIAELLQVSLDKLLFFDTFSIGKVGSRYFCSGTNIDIVQIVFHLPCIFCATVCRKLLKIITDSWPLIYKTGLLTNNKKDAIFLSVSSKVFLVSR